MKNYGFTLAEVLITLGIIGIVAAMTLPTIVSKYQEKVLVERLKQSYSIFSQAYLRAVRRTVLRIHGILENLLQWRGLKNYMIYLHLILCRENLAEEKTAALSMTIKP